MSGTLSDEQKGIIGSKAKRKVVIARAGTGKTTTLMSYAKNRPDKRILYIVYNKSMQEEFNRKSALWKLNHVVAKTIHSLAYNKSDLVKKAKIVGNITYSQYKDVMNMNVDYSVYKRVMEGLSAFCNSNFNNIEQVFVTPASAKTQLISLWGKMNRGESPITHDVYLKAFASTKPDLSSDFDVIMLDEAQDTNPVMAQLLENVSCELVIVGDPEQQIYSFRGARNIMSTFEGEAFSLTKSWRFNPLIAEKANKFLQYKDSYPLLTGNEQPHVSKEAPALICRTVAGAIHYARKTLRDREPLNLRFNGGIEGYRTGDLLDVWHLRHGNNDLIQNREIKRVFKDWASYQYMAEDAEDSEMLWNARLVDEMLGSGENMPAMLEQLKYQEKNPDSNLSTLTITTAHRSKGLEFPFVTIHSDFNDVLDQMDSIYKNANAQNAYKHKQAMESFDKIGDEINLMYVAVTRTQTGLDNQSAAIERLIAFGDSEKNKRIYRELKEMRLEMT